MTEAEPPPILAPHRDFRQRAEKPVDIQLFPELWRVRTQP
jgi:hypothetical protein